MKAKRRAQEPPATSRDRVLVGAVAGVLLVLALAVDDRHVGLVADGRQMIRTAVAIAETGQIGQATGRDFALVREQGDAVSRYGMAMSFLQLPAAWLAPWFEARGAPGRSQALFLIVPWLCVGLAAGFAGFVARRLGGGNQEVVGAVLLASIASPLGAYAALEFSEPVQAAALAGAFAASVAAATAAAPRSRLAALAGFCCGVAVLTKSSLALVAPAALLPMIDPGASAKAKRLVRAAALGAAPAIVVWVAFEAIRFGRLFGGYPDDPFSHPWLDGAWRLLVGPNRGLLLFWPALAVFVWAVRRTGVGFTTVASRALLGAALVLGLQLAIAAGYWGWHGLEGWGPRLIVASVPLLAPFAAIAAGHERRWLLIATVGLCFLVNLPPLVQHPTPVATYITNLAWPEISVDEARRYPSYATAQSASGQPAVVPFAVLERESAANPWRVYFWFARVSRADDRELPALVARPPWIDARPDLVPTSTWSPAVARQVVPRPQLGFLGRSLTGTGGPYETVYLDALLDQVVRAHQQGDVALALDLSWRRFQMAPDGATAAWRLESLRRAGRAPEAQQFLRSLPEATRREPLINVVLALFDREAGEERRARALLGSVAEHFPGTAVPATLDAPLTAWPPTLDAMTRVDRHDAFVGGR